MEIWRGMGGAQQNMTRPTFLSSVAETIITNPRHRGTIHETIHTWTHVAVLDRTLRHPNIRQEEGRDRRHLASTSNIRRRSRQDWTVEAMTRIVLPLIERRLHRSFHPRVADVFRLTACNTLTAFI